MRFRCYASTCIRNHNPGSEHNPIAIPRESICFSLASIGSTSHWKHSVKLKSWLSCRYKVNTFLLLLLFSHLSCVRLFCDPVDCSLPGSSVHGISLASILEWVAISIFLTQSLNPWLYVSALAGKFFISEPPGIPEHIKYFLWTFEGSVI